MHRVSGYNSSNINYSRRDGQILFLTVIVLAAIFIGTSAIAGYLMAYQLSQAGRVSDSAKAIFAADAANEEALYWLFRCSDQSLPGSTDQFCDLFKNFPDNSPVTALTPFNNGATYSLLIDYQGNSPPAALSVDIIKAIGSAGKTSRALSIDF